MFHHFLLLIFKLSWLLPYCSGNYFLLFFSSLSKQSLGWDKAQPREEKTPSNINTAKHKMIFYTKGAIQKTIWESNSFFFGFIFEFILVISFRKATHKDKCVNMTLKSYPCYMKHIAIYGLFIYLHVVIFLVIFIFFTPFTF